MDWGFLRHFLIRGFLVSLGLETKDERSGSGWHDSISNDEQRYYTRLCREHRVLSISSFIIYRFRCRRKSSYASKIRHSAEGTDLSILTKNVVWRHSLGMAYQSIWKTYFFEFSHFPVWCTIYVPRTFLSLWNWIEQGIAQDIFGSHRFIGSSKLYYGTNLL